MGLSRWPLFDLTLRTPRLELRLPTDSDLAALADLAAAGVHDPVEMPFLVPWTDTDPDQRARNVLQWHWRCRGELTADNWRLEFAVFEAGRCVGTQGLHAEDFRRRRTVTTGSWVGLAHQGRGIGTGMRAAVLHLAFAGLGAERAETEAFEDNAASLVVTRRLGYEPSGDAVLLRRGQPARCLRFRLSREQWAPGRRDDVTIDGLDPCLPLLGLS